MTRNEGTRAVNFEKGVTCVDQSVRHGAGPGSERLSAKLTVENYLHGVRIDSFLVRHFRNYTPFRMQRLVRAGYVRIEGIVAEGTSRVYRGQLVEVTLVEPPDHLLPPEERDLEVLYEDQWIIVVNKPADLVVHPCGNYATGSLANALQAHFDRQTQLRGLVRPGIVHRLDRLTSGVMVIPKDHLAHRHLGMSWEQGRVSKSYLAIVHGEVAGERGDVNVPIGQWPGGGTIRMSVSTDSVDPRASRTLYEVVERFSGYTLVMCRPLTGRLHQIRVHMSSIGHPLLADEFYGPAAVFRTSDLRQRIDRLPSPFFGSGDKLPTTGRAYRETSDDRDEEDDEEPGPIDIADDPSDPILLRRQALHALGLKFLHPITLVPMSFEAKPSPDFQHVLAQLRALNCPVATGST